MRALHVGVLLLCVVVAGYAASIVAGDPSWPRMLLWFVAAVLLHDAVLLPLAAGTDRVLRAAAPRARVPVVNHVRVPLLGAALTFLLFLPGIIRQGEATHLAATGLDQQPYLDRWLVLVAVMTVVSAAIHAIRTAKAALRSGR